MAIQMGHLLVEGHYYSHFYLCNYKPKYSGTDRLSESLIRFKENNKLDVEAWSSCAIQSISKLKLKEPSIIRALGASEIAVTKDTQTSLDWMGSKLAEALHGTYQPEVLSKSRTTKSLKRLSKTEREREMAGVYNCSIQFANDVLIIDDILTTGSTINAIINSMKKIKIKGRIVVFTLANTDHMALFKQDLNLAGTNYVWEDQSWSLVKESKGYYQSLQDLINRINNDDF